MTMTQAEIDEWKDRNVDIHESPPASIHFEPCYQPGDDSLKEKIESLWHQAASLSEEISQRTYISDTQNEDALCSRTIKQVYQGGLSTNRHLLVSVITHVICSLIIERLLSSRWQTIREQHRTILEHMYERQLERNLKRFYYGTMLRQ